MNQENIDAGSERTNAGDEPAVASESAADPQRAGLARGQVRYWTEAFFLAQGYPPDRARDRAHHATQELDA